MHSAQMKEKPKISIVIPTFNESAFIEKCLQSIFDQKYPPKKLEVLVVDNYSTDNTVALAKKFPVRILMNKIKDAQASKMVALRQAHGEYFIYLDADIELVGRHWFDKMLRPLLENKEIVGAFTRVKSRPSDPAMTRYLSYDPFQRDPIFQFLSPGVEATIIEKHKRYLLC